MATPYTSEKQPPSSGFIVVARPSARPAPAIDHHEAAAPELMAINHPMSPRATAVVCCGVYQRDRGMLSMRIPLKDHAVMASILVSASNHNGWPLRTRSKIA